MRFNHLIPIALAAGTVSVAFAATFTHESQRPSKLLQPKASAQVAVPQTKAYGWLLRDQALDKGLVELSLDNPTQIKLNHKLADKAWSGAFVDGSYYFYRYKDDAANENWIPLAFSKVDLATGKVTDIASWSDKQFISNDMAYDHATGTLYALSREIYADDFLSSLTFEYSGLYKIDINTGAATQVKQFIDWNSGALANPTYLTLTADLDGNIYTIDINGCLYRLDPSADWAAKLIGDTGRRPTTSIQSMDYDPATGMIYWAADYKRQVADLCVVNPATAETKVVGALGNDSRLCGLHVDFKVPGGGAPAGVADLILTPAADGSNKVEVSWTNPSKTFGGANLASLTGITLLRDGVKVNEWKSPAPGGKLSFSDSPAEKGYRTYTVASSNALGAGLERKAVAWVGRDVPDAPGNPGIGRNDDGSAVIQWLTPATGMHGGWFDAAGLRYKITRLPDGKVVAADATGNEFIDNTVPSMGKYQYSIVPYTSDGEGPEARTIEIALGKEVTRLPYNCLFDDQSVFDTWTVVNANGGSTWKWKKRGLKDFDAFAMYEYDNNNAGDDYLISPAFTLAKGGKYSVKFNYRGSNANHTEKFEVVFGNAATKEGMATSLKSYTVKSGDGEYDTLELPEITEDGTYYVGFHAQSEPKMYNLYITDVTVAQTSGPTPPPGPDVLPPATDLKAFVDADNKRVTLTWNSPNGSGDNEEPVSTPIFDDFESYPEWVLNPSGKYLWNYIDADGGRPYRSDYDDMPYPTDGQPCAAMIMAPYELTKQVYEPNPPYSGDKYLLFKSNFSAGDGSRPAPAPEDYFISPRLGFDKDFVFSFYCKADPDWESAQEGMTGDMVWNKEQFRVGYSLTGREAADFKWFTDANEQVVSTGTSWVKKEYAVPADAKYVCIKYCTPQNGFWFMVDDVYIGPAQTDGAMMRAAAERPTFKTFDVYLDGAKVMTTTGNSHELLLVEDGDHKAKVVAVYEEGEAEPAEVAFTMASSGIDSIFAEGTTADVFNADGILLRREADKAYLETLPAGVYLLRAADRTIRIIR